MSESKRNDIVYESAIVYDTPKYDLPTNKRVPKGWTAVPIGTRDKPLKLKWPTTSVALDHWTLDPSVRLRITLAIEMREEWCVEAYLLQSGTVLGVFDIRYAYVFHPHEMVLNVTEAKAILREGLGLRITGETDSVLWIFDDLAGDVERSLFTPHLMIGEEGQRLEQFCDRLMSLSSLQPFGWLEGCVLDGLYDFRHIVGANRADEVISRHLQQFIIEDGKLHYEDLHGRPADGRFSGNESTLPMAVIAKLQMDHPLVNQVIEYWPNIENRNTFTAESAYTVGYPAAVIATRQDNKQLAQMAIQQILIRRERLIDGDDLYGIVRVREQERTLRNWARSYTWYMLGMVRTWIELNQSQQFAGLPGMQEMADELRRVAQVVLSRREPEGLWSCFIGEPETGIETSGSAGIAAALALGARHGLLPEEAYVAAKKALRSLENYLTPDGILSGVCQHNCGGLQLQRGGYRVLSQMGMGLMAQLYAAIQ